MQKIANKQCFLFNIVMDMGDQYIYKNRQALLYVYCVLLNSRLCRLCEGANMVCNKNWFYNNQIHVTKTRQFKEVRLSNWSCVSCHFSAKLCPIQVLRGDKPTATHVVASIDRAAVNNIKHKKYQLKIYFNINCSNRFKTQSGTEHTIRMVNISVLN